MPKSIPEKRNSKSKSDSAGWQDDLGDLPKDAPADVKLVCQPEPEPAKSMADSDGSKKRGKKKVAASAAGNVEEITGTNIGAPQSSSVDVAIITGTEAGAEAAEVSDDDEMAAGEVIADQYEIVCKLGRGGMSTVYKAQDRMMRRFVAVKCLHAHLLSDKNSVMRFQKEAQAAGNLNHPHIVKIHQYGLDSAKRPFLVMDYLEGESLQELIDAGNRLDVDQTMRVLVEAADGLDQAHKKGVVHRDFKPSNIMLVNSEEEKDSVKIVDFGIAKIIAQPGEEGHSLTQTGEMLGSPNYMSPEQCMMMPLDNRSDIYAFGCTMFAAFTGRAPFSSGNLVEIYYKHISELPDSISVSRPDLKEATQLDAVILKCMAKDPADRYQTMAQARDAIQAIIDGGKQSLVDSFKDQIQVNLLKGKARKGKKLSIIAIASVTCLVAVVGLGAYFSGQLGKTDEQNWHDFYVRGQERIDEGDYKDAESCLNRALTAANSTGKMLDFVIPTLDELLDVSVIQGDTAKAQKYRTEIAGLTKQYENSFPDLDARIKAATNQVDGGPVAVKDKMSKEEIEQLCQSINDQAGQLIKTGFLNKGLALLNAADHLAARGLEPNALVQFRTLHNSALCYHLLGDLDKSHELYEQTIAFVKKNMSASDPALIKTLTGLATVDWHLGQPKLALSEYREANRIANLAFGPGSLQAADVKVATAEFYNNHQNSRLGLEELRQAWKIYQTHPEGEPAQRARCLASLAFADPSLATLQQSLKLQEGIATKDSFTYAWLLRELGNTAMRQPAAFNLSKEAAKERAAAYYKRSLAYLYRTKPRDEVMVADLYTRLNSYYMGKNQVLGMEPWYLQKIAVDKDAYGDEAPILVDDNLALARVYRQARQLDKCEKALKQALVIAQKAESGTRADNKVGNKEEGLANLNLFKAKAALAALNADRGLTEAAMSDNKEALALFESLSPEQQEASGANEFFYHYAGMLEKVGHKDQAQTLRESHKAFFGK